MASVSATAFHVLLVLSDGDSHGYRIAQEVEQLTDGEVRLGVGPLYRTLKQLVLDGWIVERVQHGDETRRRVYHLTARGRRFLEEEAKRLDRLARVVRRRVLLPRTGES